MTYSNVPGAPCWIELFTPDTGGAKTFYGELFGWTAVDNGLPEYGAYITFEHDGDPVAGCMFNDGTSGSPSAWSVYLESDHAANTAAMAEANGGAVLVEPMQVGEMGYMAIVSDPGGAAVGIWQSLAHTGFAVRGEVGAPAWFEVLTKDYATVIPFYGNVFGWNTHTMSDTDDFRYTTLGKDENALAGIMDATGLLGDQPSHWNFYVEVADTDDTVARALAAGGSQLMPTDDSPYGRLAALADPAGVRFTVMGPNLASPRA